MTKNVSFKTDKKKIIECVNSLDYLLQTLKTVIADIESGDDIIPCEAETVPIEDDIIRTIYLTEH